MRHYFPLASAHSPVAVHLVGCGGTGSALAGRLVFLNQTLLALGHPGISVTVYDPDHVTDANVGRQLFYREDIGHPKATILVTRINQCTGFSWAAEPRWYPSGRDREAALVITAVDTGKARVTIRNALRVSGRDCTYWLDCGNSQQNGQVILGTSGAITQPKRKDVIDRLPTVLDLYPEIADPKREKDQGPSCSLAEAIEQQDLYINQFVALEASQLLWFAFRRGYIDYSVAYVSLTPRNTRVLPIDPEVWKRFGYRIEPRKAKKGKSGRGK